MLNWAPPGADVENYDLTGKTEGTHFMKIAMLIEGRGRIENRGLTSIYFGGLGNRLKQNSQNFRKRVEGICETWTAFGLCVLYLSNASTYAHGSEYLVWKRATNDYFPFCDNAQTMQEYAKGCTISIPTYVARAGNANVLVEFDFDVIW